MTDEASSNSSGESNGSIEGISLGEHLNVDSQEESSSEVDIPSQNSSPDSEDVPSWEWAPGIKGEGTPPEGWKSTKYKTVVDQINAYNDLRKKLSGFTGAPEEYEINLEQLGDKYKDINPQIEGENQLLGRFKEFGKAANMNQETFNKALQLYADIELERHDFEENLIKDYQKAEIAKLGEKPVERLKNIKTWALQNLKSFDEKRFLNCIQNSDIVVMLEELKEAQRGPAVEMPETIEEELPSREELRKMNVDPRMIYDKKFQDKVHKLYEKVIAKEQASA